MVLLGKISSDHAEPICEIIMRISHVVKELHPPTHGNEAKGRYKQRK